MSDHRLAQASDPAATGDALRELLETSHRDGPDEAVRIQRALASNPNTPSDLLLRLLPKHAAAVWNNPAFPLALLENPGYFEGLPAHERGMAAQTSDTAEQLRAIFGRPEWVRAHSSKLLENRATPPEFFMDLAPRNHADLLVSVAHPSAPGWWLSRHVEGPSAEIRQKAAAHPAMPAWHLARLRRAGATEALEAPEASLEPLPLRELRWLAGRGYLARLLAARNPAATIEIVREAWRSDEAELSMALVRHPDVTGDDLDRVAGQNERERRPRPGALRRDRVAPLFGAGDLPRCAAARHPRARPATLARLANDRSEAVRASAATHPALPAAALSSLGRDDHPAVLLEALKNPLMPAEAVEAVALADPPEFVARMAARHPNAGPGALGTLAARREGEARALARSRLGW